VHCWLDRVRDRLGIFPSTVAWTALGLALTSLFFQVSWAAAQDFNGRSIRHLFFLADGPIRNISRDDLQKLVVLQEGQTFTDSKARATVIQLLATELFWNAEVRVEAVDEQTVDVRVLLVRLYQVSRVHFTGRVELPTHELTRELDFREGEPYSDDALERSITRLKTLYQRHGFYEAGIQPSFKLDEQDRPRLTVTFSVDAGKQATVASLQMDVERPADAPSLRAVMKTRQGKPFSQVQLDSDLHSILQHLALEGYFHPEVYVKDGAQYDEKLNVVTLVLRVVPREHTDVHWVGLTFKDSELLKLPLYANPGPRRLLLEETVDAVTEQLQNEGFFRAKVSFQVTGQGFPPNEVTITVAPGRKYDLSKIRFEGNSAVPTRVLREALVSKQAGILSRGTLTDETLGQDSDNIQTIYQHRGYLDVAVQHHFDENGGNLTLVYDIHEGPQYHVGSISLSGNAHLSTEQLLKDASLKKGGVYSPYLLASDRSLIQAAYETRGYQSAEVDSTIEHEPNHVVDVRYAIDEGEQFFTKHVLVAGNQFTKRKVIDQQILVEPGKPLSYEKLLESETNLYNLAVFNQVKIKEVPVYESTTENSALFSLQEAKKYSLVYGVGYSHSFGSTASEGLRGTLGITDINFQGMARILSLSLRGGSRGQRGNVSYSLPRLIGRQTPVVLSFSVDNEKRIESNNTATVIIEGRPYDAFRVIGSMQAERALSRRESLFFRYNFERLKLTLPVEPTLPPAFFREEANLILSKIGLSYLNDSRNLPDNPSQGFFLNGEATLAAKPLGSQRQFAKLFTQGRYYFPLLTDLTLVTALRLGVIEPFGPPPSSGESRVPISERFFAGGPSTLRGLPIDLAGPLLEKNGQPVLVPTNPQPGQKQVPVPLGGNALIVGNVELRFPIYRRLGGALFYDVGNVFESLSAIPSSPFENDFGFGIAVRTPIGPVRIDFAYNPNPPDVRQFSENPKDVQGYNRWNIHFNIGNPF
jgi:outer membrane protein insertion porin family